MTALLLVVDAVLTAAAGAALTGLLRSHLSLLERAAVAATTGIILSSAVTYVLSLFGGLNTLTVLAGPLWLLAAGTLAARWLGNPFLVWHADSRQALQRWRTHPPLGMALIALAAAVFVGLVYSRTVYSQNGAVVAGYETVWADWSQHLTTASSFAVAQNLPPTNPLFSGTPLLYPFLPDYHGAMLMVLGLSAGSALALGSASCAFLLVLLVVALARRVGLSLGAAAVATAVCVVGGGLGFVGVFSDACTQSFAASQCNVGYMAGHPGELAGIVFTTLHNLPGTIAAQPRAYDGLLTQSSAQVLPDQQWYTPLFAWWLPQRSMLYGFDAAVAVLILALAARHDPRPAWTTFALAGVLVGVMPLVHAQSLLVLVIFLAVLAAFRLRREWIALLVPAALFAAPRLVQIALTPHGQAAAGNVYPYFEPGWEANASDHIAFSLGGAPTAIGTALRLLVTPQWWGFWVANLGVALPLCVVTAVAALARGAPGAAGRAARRLTQTLHPSLLHMLLAAMIVFALCDVVVFQSWDWDNTKLLVYWYLVAGMVAAALAAHWWRRSAARTLLAVLLPTSMLATGVLVVLRLLPWTPPQDSVTGPYTIASSDEVVLATEVAKTAPAGAVFLTFGRPNDPLLAVAGRTGVMGYYGWLWSYGTDFGTRVSDVQAMYAGCGRAAACRVVQLLHRYDISFVEIDDRVSDPGAITSVVNAGWWAHQGYRVVARSEHITVYDVRGA